MSAFSEPMPQRAFHASAAVLLGVAVIALLPPAKANADSDAVKRAKSWTYQLQGDTSRVKRSNADVAVIDPDHAGSAAKYKTKRNGEEREVLAYISVGEVEEGRRYMNKGGRKYSTGRTQGWKGNYAAKYWEPGWKEIVKRRVKEALEAVQMLEYARRKPNQLSGGQQQRVALARALVIRPDVLLLDEPLSNLDAKLRLDLRSEIRRICKSAGLTTVYVTHDQKEALSMADRIAIMKGGQLQQTGTPQDLYRHPDSQFVASFLGETNFIEAKVAGHDAPDRLALETSAGKLLATIHSGDSYSTGQRVTCS